VAAARRGAWLTLPEARPYDARPGVFHGGSRRFLRDDQP
jgi:hypothetical protein